MGDQNSNPGVPGGMPPVADPMGQQTPAVTPEPTQPVGDAPAPQPGAWTPPTPAPEPPAQAPTEPAPQMPGVPGAPADNPTGNPV